MVEIADIKDKDSLEEWLQGKPRELAVVIAARAAARSMPFSWVTAPSPSIHFVLTDLRGWRSLSLARVFAEHPTGAAASRASISAAAAAAAASAANFSISTDVDANILGACATVSASAAYASTSTDDEASISAAASASAAVYYAANYAAANACIDADPWHEIRRDADCYFQERYRLCPPLWWQRTPQKLRGMWELVKDNLKTEISAGDTGWQFFIDWYEDQLSGAPQNWEMLREIVLIPDEDWQKGIRHLGPIIEDIQAKYANGTDKNGPDPVDLFVATLFDFTYDKMEFVMRAVPMGTDWKVLQDPARLSAFLEDASDLREDLELMCLALRAEGTAMQGASSVATYADAILSILQKAGEIEWLRVDKLMEYGRILEAAARNDDTIREFGVNAEPLRINSGKLRALIRDHFAHTLARFSVLRDIHMEEDAPPWEVLREIREIVEQVKTGGKEALPPLHQDDVAVLTDVLDSVDGLIRDMENTDSEESRTSFGREIDFQLAKIGATAGVYREKAKGAVAKTGDGADGVIKWHKRGEGLRAFGRFIRELFETGGGGV